MCLFSHSLAPKVGIFRTQQKNAKIKIEDLFKKLETNGFTKNFTIYTPQHFQKKKSCLISLFAL